MGRLVFDRASNEEKLTHLFRLFLCVRLIISVRRSLRTLVQMFAARPFLVGGIFTHFIRQFICVELVGCLGVLLCLWAPMLVGVYSHTFLFCLFLHGCFTAVTVFGGFVKLVCANFRTRHIHTPFL